jgi:uncharacterized delta-60 repeat protein
MSVSLLAIALLSSRATAQVGLDPAFGTGGVVRIGFSGPATTRGEAMAVEAGGRILVAGMAASSLGYVGYVSAFLRSGALDTTFGTGGFAFLGEYSRDHLRHAGALAIQTDGRIVVAGTAWSAPRTERMFVDRLLPDGRVDASFGDSGRVEVGFHAQESSAYGIALQADGKTVVTGTASTWGTPELELVAFRLHTDGTLDPAFGSGGVVRTGVAAQGRAMALAPDGRIVVVGDSSGDSRIVRLLSNGSIDPGFGSDGVFVAADRLLGGLSVGPGGEVITVGTAFVGTRQLATALRLDASGHLDPSFGTGGVVDLDLPKGEPYWFPGLVREPKGSVTVAGSVRVDGNSHVVVFRLDPSGGLDTRFGEGGFVSDVWGSSWHSSPNGLRLLPDGKLLLLVRTFGPTWGSTLTRFSPDGSLDTSFGESGSTRRSATGEMIDIAFLVHSEPDGGLVVAGSSYASA